MISCHFRVPPSLKPTPPFEPAVIPMLMPFRPVGVVIDIGVPAAGANVCKPVHVGTIATDRAGAPSDRMKVAAVPFTADKPTCAVGLAPATPAGNDTAAQVPSSRRKAPIALPGAGTNPCAVVVNRLTFSSLDKGYFLAASDAKASVLPLLEAELPK